MAMKYEELVAELQQVRDMRGCTNGLTHHEARPRYLDILHRSTSEQIEMIITQWLEWCEVNCAKRRTPGVTLSGYDKDDLDEA